MPINTLIVDDEELIRNNLSILLSSDKEIYVAAVCKNGDEAFRMTLSNPDIQVILMDIQMPICNGILATKSILNMYPHMKIIALTTFDDDHYVHEILFNGAKGYILKSVPPNQIIDAIKIVHSGNMLLHPDVALKLPGMLKVETEKSHDFAGLSEVEICIVKFISQGYTNREIGTQIHLSEGTVKNKISDILNKLGLRDRTQIVIHFLSNGKNLLK